MATYILARVCSVLLEHVVEDLGGGGGGGETTMDGGQCAQGKGHYQIHPSPPMSYSNLPCYSPNIGLKMLRFTKFATNYLMID